MSSFLLRLEGVNLDNFVYDTPDLSTIRGGGLLLLDAVQVVEGVFKLTPISTGASVGLFKFVVDDVVEARKKAKEVAEYLSRHELFQYATFVVDVEEETDFVSSRERILARNRWRQQKQPTVSVVELFAGTTSHWACAKDLVRPGIEKVINPEKQPELLSASVHARREHGRDKKKSLYHDLTGVAVSTSQEFEELAAPPGHQKQWTTPLYYKMAVIYADGNHFGKKQSALVSSDDLKAWDIELQSSRKAMLKALLEQAKIDPQWHENDSLDAPIRLETLLWGGDELIWVVPAWKGFETLELFFAQSKTWKVPGPENNEKLTHAAGVVFCSFKSPIKRVKELAKDLAEEAKKKSRNEDGFAVEFLESFDHVGSAEDALRRNGPKDGDVKNMVFKGSDLSELLAGIRAIKSPRVDFPRRKLHEAAFIGEPNEDVEKLLEAHLEQRLPGKWEALREKLGGPAAWCNLWAFWDYVPNPDDFPKEAGR